MNTLVRKGLFAIKILYYKLFPIGKDVDMPSSCSLGNPGASFTVVPSDLSKGSVVYSFGIGTDVSFDLALMSLTGASIHAFDPTPRSVEWIKKTSLPQGFIFHEWGISSEDGTLTFFPPKDPSYVSYSSINNENKQEQGIVVPVFRLSTMMSKLGHDHIDLLKMDIEGMEYDVLEDILKEGIRVRQIVVEFHHRFKNFGVFKTRDIVRKLNAAEYKVFDISDTGEEISFVRS